MIRPLLLLDVDGVLMPLGRSVPPGFERRETATMDIVVSRQHGQWLHELAPLFDLVWATTWGATANPAFGQFYGLPTLPNVELVDLPRSGTRKLSAVTSYVGDRSMAWIDDELYEDAEAWAQARTPPTLLLRTAPYVGLRAEHVDELKEFANSTCP